MVWAQRFCLCVVVFAGVNWLLNVLHWRWVLRYDRVQVSTWMGCVEINWYAPGGSWFMPTGVVIPPNLFPSRTKLKRAEFSRGGVMGRNGLATVLAHVMWLPRVEDFDSSGQPRSATAALAVPGTTPPGFSVDHTRVTIPMWGLGMLSGVPYALLVYRARRRRQARLCDVCDYSLVGLSAGADGLTMCPECGERMRVGDGPGTRA